MLTMACKNARYGFSRLKKGFIIFSKVSTKKPTSGWQITLMEERGFTTILSCPGQWCLEANLCLAAF